MSAADVTRICNDLDDLASAPTVENVEVLKQVCEDWAELKPPEKIERVPFVNLARRLLLLSPSSTDFARYRGMELKATRSKTVFDANIVPKDLGEELSCLVEAENRSEGDMLYTYSCVVKTPTYKSALELRDLMVNLLKPLDLGENEVREHGLAVHAKQSGYCAPSGQCSEAHMFVSMRRDWKTLQIDPVPTFVRLRPAPMETTEPSITGISPSSGELRFQVLSVGPATTQP